MYKCRDCDKSYERKSSLKRHYEIVHLKTRQDTRHRVLNSVVDEDRIFKTSFGDEECSYGLMNTNWTEGKRHYQIGITNRPLKIENLNVEIYLQKVAPVVEFVLEKENIREKKNKFRLILRVLYEGKNNKMDISNLKSVPKAYSSDVRDDNYQRAIDDLVIENIEYRNTNNFKIGNIMMLELVIV